MARIPVSPSFKLNHFKRTAKLNLRHAPPQFVTGNIYVSMCYSVFGESRAWIGGNGENLSHICNKAPASHAAAGINTAGAECSGRYRTEPGRAIDEDAAGFYTTP
jgi:hypothetical protein